MNAAGHPTPDEGRVEPEPERIPGRPVYTAQDLADWGVRHWLPGVVEVHYGWRPGPGDRLEDTVRRMGEASSVATPETTPGVVAGAVRGLLLDACAAVLEGREPERGDDRDHRLGIVKDFTAAAAEAAYAALLGQRTGPERVG